MKSHSFLLKSSQLNPRLISKPDPYSALIPFILDPYRSLISYFSQCLMINLELKSVLLMSFSEDLLSGLVSRVGLSRQASVSPIISTIVSEYTFAFASTQYFHPIFSNSISGSKTHSLSLESCRMENLSNLSPNPDVMFQG